MHTFCFLWFKPLSTSRRCQFVGRVIKLCLWSRWSWPLTYEYTTVISSSVCLAREQSFLYVRNIEVWVGRLTGHDAPSLTRTDQYSHYAFDETPHSVRHYHIRQSLQHCSADCPAGSNNDSAIHRLRTARLATVLRISNMLPCIRNQTLNENVLEHLNFQKAQFLDNVSLIHDIQCSQLYSLLIWP